MNVRRFTLATVFLAAGAHAQQASPTFPPLAASGGGRYVLGQISPARADQYMLDTQTGRVWQLACIEQGEGISPCKRMILQPVLLMQDFVSRELSPYPPQPLPLATPAKK